MTLNLKNRWSGSERHLIDSFYLGTSLNTRTEQFKQKSFVYKGILMQGLLNELNHVEGREGDKKYIIEPD